MPIYNFQNKDTDEIIEVVMSINERGEFLETYPEWKQVTLTAPALGDPVRLGVKHHDGEFNDLLKTIKKNNRHSTINPR